MQDVIVSSADKFLDTTINGWLHEKFNHSGSEKTRRAYADTITQFRSWLWKEGLDLNSKNDEDIVRISFVAQAYATYSAKGKKVAPATINQRLAILSSFYEYAKGKRLLKENPVDSVKRSKVQAYASARALDNETVQRAFSSIDLQKEKGKRDYVLLAILLYTGRRLQEVASLQLQHISIQRGCFILSFEHCKGDKQMRDTLPVPITNALLAWLQAYYGVSVDIDRLEGDERPVWVSLAHGGKTGNSYGQSLGTQAIADVCEEYLKTSQVHRLRHTFAHTMQTAGANPSEIQAKLGHESLATTGRYLAQLKQEENKYGDILVALYGINNG